MSRRFWGLGAAGLGCCAASLASAQTVAIFNNDDIGFGDGQSREIDTTVLIPHFDETSRLTVHLDIDPNEDPWDRAGSLHLITADGKQVQLLKFITGFAGDTDHSRDITNLAPLLKAGPARIEAFIDTWVGDAWKVSARIEIEDAPERHPTWTAPVISRNTGWRTTQVRNFTVDVPEGMEKVVLTYFASGHHYEQTSNSDEFNQRRHHIYVDGKEVWSEIPWRTDGPNFRDVNPTSGRWDGNGDGDTSDPWPTDYWSSDFPRSGWVPGDQVYPYEIDLTEYLADGGTHTIGLKIDGIDKDSFWRVSSYLSGTPAPVPEPGAAAGVLSVLALARWHGRGRASGRR